MSEEAVEQLVLKLLSNGTTNEAAYRSLTTIFEQVAEPANRRAELFDHIDPYDDDKEALRAILDQMALDGLLDARMDERDYERSYRLTDQGLYEAAFDEIPLVAQNLEKTSRPVPLRVDSAVSATTSDEVSIVAHDPPKIDSSNWTGTKHTVVDAKVLFSMRVEIRALFDLSHRINYQSDEDAQDMKGLTTALVALSEMAEPDIPLILRILAHPKFKIYAALFAAAATVRGALGI